MTSDAAPTFRMEVQDRLQPWRLFNPIYQGMSRDVAETRLKIAERIFSKKFRLIKEEPRDRNDDHLDPDAW